MGTRRHHLLAPRLCYVVVYQHYILIFGCKGTHISKNCKVARHFFLLKNQAKNKASENYTYCNCKPGMSSWAIRHTSFYKPTTPAHKRKKPSNLSTEGLPAKNGGYLLPPSRVGTRSPRWGTGRHSVFPLRPRSPTHPCESR